MSDDTDSDKTWKLEYEKLLNKKDPLDQRILKLAKKGKLKLEIVEIKEGNEDSFKKYSRESIPHRGKHTS